MSKKNSNKLPYVHLDLNAPDEGMPAEAGGKEPSAPDRKKPRKTQQKDKPRKDAGSSEAMSSPRKTQSKADRRALKGSTPAGDGLNDERESYDTSLQYDLQDAYSLKGEFQPEPSMEAFGQAKTGSGSSNPRLSASHNVPKTQFGQMMRSGALPGMQSQRHGQIKASNSDPGASGPIFDARAQGRGRNPASSQSQSSPLPNPQEASPMDQGGALVRSGFNNRVPTDENEVVQVSPLVYQSFQRPGAQRPQQSRPQLQQADSGQSQSFHGASSPQSQEKQYKGSQQTQGRNPQDMRRMQMQGMQSGQQNSAKGHGQQSASTDAVQHDARGKMQGQPQMQANMQGQPQQHNQHQRQPQGQVQASSQSPYQGLMPNQQQAQPANQQQIHHGAERQMQPSGQQQSQHVGVQQSQPGAQRQMQPDSRQQAHFEDVRQAQSIAQAAGMAQPQSDDQRSQQPETHPQGSMQPALAQGQANGPGGSGSAARQNLQPQASLNQRSVQQGMSLQNIAHGQSTQQPLPGMHHQHPFGNAGGPGLQDASIISAEMQPSFGFQGASQQATTPSRANTKAQPADKGKAEESKTEDSPKNPEGEEKDESSAVGKPLLDANAIQESPMFDEPPVSIEDGMKNLEKGRKKRKIALLIAIIAVVVAGGTFAACFALAQQGILPGTAPAQQQDQGSSQEGGQKPSSTDGSGASSTGGASPSPPSGSEPSSAASGSASSAGAAATEDKSGEVVYQYSARTAGGVEYQVEETVTFQYNGDCGSSTMNMTFPTEAAARTFTDNLARDYGSGFRLDSLNGTNAIVTIDNSGLHLNRDEYENALRYSVTDLVIVKK